MAKSLRSKVKRHFRLLRRDVVTSHPHQVEVEEKRQAAMDAAVAAPHLVPDQPTTSGGPDAEEGAGASMDVDAQPLPEITSQNCGRMLKKLRSRRLAATKGITAPKTKKSNPLAGANQFHKPKGKKRH